MLHKAGHTLTPKPDEATTGRGNHTPTSQINRPKSPQQNISKLNSAIHKSVSPDQWNLFQGTTNQSWDTVHGHKGIAEMIRSSQSIQKKQLAEPSTLGDKNTKQTGNRKNPPHHREGRLRKTHGQHQMVAVRKLLLQFKNKARASPLVTSVQCGAGALPEQSRRK